jgi:hypothetical protein
MHDGKEGKGIGLGALFLMITRPFLAGEPVHGLL